LDIFQPPKFLRLAARAPAGQQIGSNHDPTGNNTQGCVTVVFCGTWAQATDLARTNVHGLQLEEAA